MINFLTIATLFAILLILHKLEMKKSILPYLTIGHLLIFTSLSLGSFTLFGEHNDPLQRFSYGEMYDESNFLEKINYYLNITEKEKVEIPVGTEYYKDTLQPPSPDDQVMFYEVMAYKVGKTHSLIFGHFANEPISMSIKGGCPYKHYRFNKVVLEDTRRVILIPIEPIEIEDSEENCDFSDYLPDFPGPYSIYPSSQED
ncbi:MAG: hypothetical protein HOO06_15265 [Bdellovibrionaceae bacterium]|jgi:hypothetical protein|nr:hypothetical protein [Pseudobdellovibrionaceae bacterium]